MSIADFVWIAVGETLLAGTFALGILVGCSIKKRTSHDSDSDEGTTEGEEDYWRDVERR